MERGGVTPSRCLPSRQIDGGEAPPPPHPIPPDLVEGRALAPPPSPLPLTTLPPDSGGGESVPASYRRSCRAPAGAKATATSILAPLTPPSRHQCLLLPRAWQRNAATVATSTAASLTSSLAPRRALSLLPVPPSRSHASAAATAQALHSHPSSADAAGFRRAPPASATSARRPQLLRPSPQPSQWTVDGQIRAWEGKIHHRCAQIRRPIAPTPAVARPSDRRAPLRLQSSAAGMFSLPPPFRPAARFLATDSEGGKAARGGWRWRRGQLGFRPRSTRVRLREVNPPNNLFLTQESNPLRSFDL
uniref:Uncharacterized protein n=1 Tax=Oryza nivara TaxID=4536 RepID=A0A0E0HSD5_ORYNI